VLSPETGLSPETFLQKLKANTWDKKPFGFDHGGKVATTTALVVVASGVCYGAYKAYIYRDLIKAYLASKNPFRKSDVAA